jgi:hypothetical protein
LLLILRMIWNTWVQYVAETQGLLNVRADGMYNQHRTLDFKEICLPENISLNSVAAKALTLIVLMWRIG